MKNIINIKKDKKMTYNTTKERKDDSLGALWEKTGKNGDTYFSGSIEINGVKENIVIFKKKQYNSNFRAPTHTILKRKDFAPNGEVNENRTNY
jgi:hypothetical protein